MSSHVRNADNQLDARWKAATPFKIQANPRLELALSSYPFYPRLDPASPLPLNPSNPSVLVLILQEFHVSTFGYFVLSTWCLKLEYSYECGYKYESSARYRCKCWQNLHNFLFSRLQNATCAARITVRSHITHTFFHLSLSRLAADYASTFANLHKQQASKTRKVSQHVRGLLCKYSARMKAYVDTYVECARAIRIHVDK